jgi:hypothetical protein
MNIVIGVKRTGSEVRRISRAPRARLFDRLRFCGQINTARDRTKHPSVFTGGQTGAPLEQSSKKCGILVANGNPQRLSRAAVARDDVNGEIMPGGRPARGDDSSRRVGKNETRLWIESNIWEAITEKLRIAPVRRRLPIIEALLNLKWVKRCGD